MACARNWVLGEGRMSRCCGRIRSLETTSFVPDVAWLTNGGRLSIASQSILNNTVATRGKPVHGVLRGDGLEGQPDGLQSRPPGSGLDAAQEGFDFAPHLFNRIEVGRVSRQEKHPSSSTRVIKLRVSWFLCGPRLSMTTILTFPGRNAGPRTCRTYVWKTSSVSGAIDGHAGRRTIQPDGTRSQWWSFASDHGECWHGHALLWEPEPHRRVRLVLAPDSSRKISRAGVKTCLLAPPEPARPGRCPDDPAHWRGVSFFINLQL